MPLRAHYEPRPSALTLPPGLLQGPDAFATSGPHCSYDYFFSKAESKAT